MSNVRIGAGKNSNNSFGKVTFKPECPYVIICEGKDEFSFLIAYLNYLQKNEESFIDCYNVLDFGGITDVSQGIDNIKKYPHYEDMKAFLIVRDAELDAEAAKCSIKNHVKQVWEIDLKDNGEMKVSNDDTKIGYYLLPGIDENGEFSNGTLEDLCLDIIDARIDKIPTSEVLSSVDKYMGEVIAQRGKDFSRPHKNRLHLYLSSTDEYVGAKVGEAAKWGAFDMSSPKLDMLKRMILEMQN